MNFNIGVLEANYPALLGGLMVTCLATAIALSIGFVVAVIMVAMRLGGGKWSRRFADAYLTFFRTTPEMVLIFWAYFCLPAVLGIQMSGLTAGSLSLGLVTGAYLAEIFRAGIQSVPKGQFEAGRALGLSRFALWTRVVLPQGVPLMTPPFINYLTELIKNTTLLAAIGVAELAYVAYNLGAQTFRYFEFITAIGIGYFLIIFPISLLSRRLEKTRRQAAM
ncbi:amino acid ABC transporter permease [Pseudoxanthobacter sp. M-2]|uniref:amino acid ABC transporter permease n=1 Tax=Pseudoxanthobacter sp. M-2 TaxID=3078754 RepID=UPI0038FCE7F3